MPKMTITYELDTIEDSYDIQTLLHASGYRSVLQELDQHIRMTTKHDDSEWLTEKALDYLDALRTMIHESGYLEY